MVHGCPRLLKVAGELRGLLVAYECREEMLDRF